MEVQRIFRRLLPVASPGNKEQVKIPHAGNDLTGAESLASCPSSVIICWAEIKRAF
jgi:hypothetical protein